MNFMGNILWLIFGGIIGGLLWFVAGILWCCTVIGIPMGIQCFKFAVLALFPFGKDIRFSGGTVSLIANIIWIALSGIEIATFYIVFGCILCITVIGIPFGMQMFKLAKLAIMPFGAEIVRA